MVQVFLWLAWYGGLDCFYSPTDDYVCTFLVITENRNNNNPNQLNKKIT